MSGTKIVVSEGAHLEMGDHSCIHCNSTVTCFAHISIGSDCAISWNTNILDGNSHDLTVDGSPRPCSAPVAIADNVWIGTVAIVLSDVTIQSGAVVRAGGVVTKDVSDRMVVAGNLRAIRLHGIRPMNSSRIVAMTKSSALAGNACRVDLEITLV
jgi:acetyltransferase-like isoleucine patch superfamily enzyme